MEMLNLAAVLKASADPIRLDILRLLRRDSLAASELALLLDIKQSALSHHLKVMTQAQWLNTRREGNTLFYRRQLSTELSIARVQQAVLASLDAEPLPKALSSELNDLRDERQAISAAFFESHAHELDTVTDRIAGYKHYADALHQALLAVDVADCRSALEIGPGDGGFLPYLSERFAQVYALDIAEPMLELARSQVQELTNIEFIHGDAHTALDKGINVDFVALNMVLHHVPSPAELLADCWQLLNEQGWLLVTDLCAHEQDWVQEACGDFWMGFDTDELLGWAKSNGFEAREPVLLGLKNGFQVQIHLFKKHATAAEHTTRSLPAH